MRHPVRLLTMAVAGVTFSVGFLLPASAQTATGPTTTAATVVVAPDTTTIVAASTTTAAPTTVLPTTTTTTVADPPLPSSSASITDPAWTAKVPGPPPPPPPPPGATPAEITLAGQLEAQIVVQSNTLDIAAEQYDQAEATVQASATRLSDIQAQVLKGVDRAAVLASGLRTAQESLKQAAVAAYISAGATPAPAINGSLVTAYEHQLNQVFADSALSRAGARVKQLHAAQVQLKVAQDALAADQRKAISDTASARVAATNAQQAAQAAALQQAQLLATTAQLKGNLPQLVAAADALQAQAAFKRFTTLNTLDFSPPGPLAAPLPQTAAAVKAALLEVGKPYVWGAAGPDTFDCSGLTKFAWLQSGVLIPRVAADQQAWATPVPISQVLPGDFVFFGSPAHHVGMYVGNGMMVNAPHSGANVGVVPIWWNDLAGFGRAHQP